MSESIDIDDIRAMAAELENAIRERDKCYARIRELDRKIKAAAALGIEIPQAAVG